MLHVRIWRFAMHSKLILSTLVAASLLGAPVIAFAQNEPTQPNSATSAEGGAGAKAPAAHHKMQSSHSHMKSGTTTGMSSSTSKSRPGGQSVARKPSGS
jgi:hypothetical protein